MNQIFRQLSSFSVLSACPLSDAASFSGSSSLMPLVNTSDPSTFLAFDMTVNSTTLYLGQYYKVTFSLTNRSNNVLTSLEVNCDLPKEWHCLSTNAYSLPAYISELMPDETLQFTLTLQLIHLPSEEPFKLYSSASYYVNVDKMRITKHSSPITFFPSLTQAAITLAAHEEKENITSYEVLIKNVGTGILTEPVLYIYMPPSIHLQSDSLSVNNITYTHAKPSNGIHLSRMLPHTLYKVSLSTMFTAGHSAKELPIVQLITNNMMFHPLPFL